MKTVTEVLQSLNLERYTRLFEENEIDLDTLLVLTDSDLEELGLPFGPRKRILNTVARFSGGALAERPPAREGGTEAGERRQLTVLFCDMVGSTELSGRLDPEVLQTVFRTYEDLCAVCISRFDGFLYQRLGDCVVAFFGYPLAHEGEAERAIRAALAITEKFASLEVPGAGRVRVRSGIATGMVVVSTPDRGAVGETMNLAARLQSLAEPDQILVSERVHNLAGGAFEYEDLGDQQLKGINRPIRAYRVDGVGATESRFEAATQGEQAPLVGRESDLGVLLDRWQRAQAGDGQVVLLAGEAGIGKSRIVSALRERIEAQGIRPLALHCSPFYVNSAFYPFIAYLQRESGIHRDDDGATALDKLEAFVVEQSGRPADEVRFLGAILSLPVEERYGTESLSPQRQKELTLTALVGFLRAASRSGASMVLFEDLHWADPTTLEVIGRLISAGTEISQLVVMTNRPEFTPPWFAHGHVTIHSLTRLTRAEAGTIVSGLTDGRRLPDDLLEQIIAKTDGIPLFVEELTKSILESGSLVEVGDRFEYGESRAAVSVPSTLRDSLMARLDRFEEAKDIAQVGAAIGREFSYELLSAVTPIRGPAFEEGLHQLTASGLVFRRGTPPDSTYVFKHALVQDVAYDSLLKRRRHELHSEIAKTLEDRFPQVPEAEPELLAHHYTAAGLTEVAIPYWRRAGELATRRFALQEATSHLHRGLALIESIPPSPARDAEELELRTLLGPTVVAMHSWADPGVGHALEPALDLIRSLGHRESHLPVLHGLWVHGLVTGRLAESVEWAHEMLTAGEAEGDEDLVVCGHGDAMTSYFWLGDLVSAWKHGAEVRRMYDEKRHRHIARLTNRDPLTGDGIYGCQYLWMLGYPDRAVAMTRENHEHARRLNHPFDLAFALTLGAEVFDFTNEPDELLRHSEEGARVGREHGIPVMSDVLAEITKGIAWLRAGRFEEASEQLALGAERLRQTGQRIWQPYLKGLVAQAVGSAGEPERALTIVREALEDSDSRDERPHYAEVLRIKGLLLIQLGRDEEAETVLRAAIDFAHHQQARSWELRAATTLARMLASRGEPGEASELVAPILDWFTEGFETYDLRQAHALLEELSARGASRN